MKIELGLGFLADNVVVEEGVLAYEHKSSNDRKVLIDHNGNVIQSHGFSIEAGTISVSRIRSMPQSMHEAGYKVGDLIAHTLIRRQEFKHQHMDKPIILIHMSSIVGKVEIETLEDIKDDASKIYYEKFVPAQEQAENKRITESVLNKAGQGDWSSGREFNMDDPFAKAIHKDTPSKLVLNT